MMHVINAAARDALYPSPTLCIPTADGGYDCYFDDEPHPGGGRTLAQAVAEKIASINQHAARARISARRSVQPHATTEEMATWPIKRAEARAFLVSQALADAPTLAAEATARNVPISDIVNRVCANADYLTGMEAVISGTAGRHRDAVNALIDVAAVDAYDFSGGWP
jgi:hypothetical protein